MPAPSSELKPTSLIVQGHCAVEHWNPEASFKPLVQVHDEEKTFMKRGWLSLLVSLPFLSVTAVFSAEHTADSLEEVQKGLTEEKAVLVDVRELREWQAGHLADAQLVPLSALGKKLSDPDFLRDLSQRLGKEQGKVVYIHCKSGGRCLMAADALSKLGYDARPLKQGYEELLKAGFKPAKGADNTARP